MCSMYSNVDNNAREWSRKIFRLVIVITPMNSFPLSMSIAISFHYLSILIYGVLYSSQRPSLIKAEEGELIREVPNIFNKHNKLYKNWLIFEPPIWGVVNIPKRLTVNIYK